MITIRKADNRGHANHGWLDTRFTFSFSDYTDPDHMGFRSLRVINEDRIEPDNGFGMHPHRDMEIVTVVLEGALAHRDSMGTSSTIRPGEIQKMSAGTGVIHSEFNPSPTEQTHLYQIWIHPDKEGLPPGYEQKAIPELSKPGLKLLAAPPGQKGLVTLHQDARMYLAVLKAGAVLKHPIGPGRHAWVQMIDGRVDVNGMTLGSSDGAAVSDEKAMELKPAKESRLLLFDLG